ncbi:MAG: hypothetical protein WCK95_12195 [Alphaproteobacteria bacterium]|jgi:hypothetical protein
MTSPDTTPKDTMPTDTTPTDTMPADAFDKLQSEDMANEVRILWSEIGIMAFLALLVAIYFIVE